MASVNAPDGYTRLTINLPTELHEKIKLVALMQKTTVGQIVSDFIKNELTPIKKGK